jgi:hypothetical protein
MGGKIEVTSFPGTGSTFSFTVSLARNKKSFLQTTSSLKILEGKNVLLIDDNASSRSIIGKQVRYARMNFTAVSSGTEGLELLAKDPPYLN